MKRKSNQLNGVNLVQVKHGDIAQTPENFNLISMQFVSPTIIVPWQINVLKIAKLFKWPSKIFSPGLHNKYV